VVFGAGGIATEASELPWARIAVRLADIAIVTSDNRAPKIQRKILDDVEAG